MIDLRGKKLVWVIIILFFMHFASAQVDVDVDAVKNVISLGETAVYNVTVTNNLRYDETFRLRFSEDVYWTVLTEPLTYKLSRFSLGVGETVSFLVKVRPSPSANLAYNQYILAIIVEGVETGEVGVGRMTLGYGPQFITPKDYAAVVSATASVPKEIDPRNKMEFKVVVRNHNPLNISSVNIFVESDLFTKYRNIPLGPLEKKEVVFTQDFDPLQNPIADTVEIRLERQNVTLVSLQKNYKVIAYSEFQREENTQEEYFLDRSSITYTNVGNHPKTETIYYNITMCERFFTKTEPAASLENGRLKWSMTLEPMEAREIRVVKNFRPLLYIAGVILIILISHRILKSPVSVHKTAEVLKKKEGGICGIQVVLKVRNSSHHVKDVWMVDSVPNILHVSRNFDVGTLEPERVTKHEKKGTLIKWHLGDIEPGEERLIRYKATAKLTILGSFTLPAAVMKFTAGMQRIVYSNRIRIVV